MQSILQVCRGKQAEQFFLKMGKAVKWEGGEIPRGSRQTAEEKKFDYCEIKRERRVIIICSMEEECQESS